MAAYLVVDTDLTELVHDHTQPVRQRPDQVIHQRRLPGPIGAENSKYFTLSH